MSYERFVHDGFDRLDSPLPADRCRALLDAARATRDFSGALFLREHEYRAAPLHRGVNPRPGRNLIERFDTSWIEEAPVFIAAMNAILGPGFRVLAKKFVCGVPESWMPEWLLAETRDVAVANLGAYVRPEHRDVTYFHGIDFHQDIIDFMGRPCDFVTLYVYLDETTPVSSPLFIVPGSQRFGATTFPHAVALDAAACTLVYDDARGHSDTFSYEMLTGPAGSTYVWHACMLHGTRPHTAEEPRLSLRYLVQRAEPPAPGLLDDANARITGPLALDLTRVDVDERGEVRLRGNTINAMTRPPSGGVPNRNPRQGPS